MKKTALLAGATGLVGSALLPRLLASERYAKVIVVGRRPVATQHSKLVQVVTDLDELEHERLRLIADDVYCCLGTTIRQAGSQEAFYKVDFLYVVRLAALTAANFAAQFLVVSSLGADRDSRFYYSRVKGEMEEAVGQAPFRAIHIFRPSLLLGERPAPRLGERLGALVLGLARPLLRRQLAQIPPRSGRHRGAGHAARRPGRWWWPAHSQLRNAVSHRSTRKKSPGANAAPGLFSLIAG